MPRAPPPRRVKRMMNLYLLRHGIAVSAEETAPDGERPLTPKGVKRLRKAARGLRRLGVSFDVILTSPLARARQTADIVAEELGLEAHVTEVEALQPNCSVDEVLASLNSYQNYENLLLVGHEPLLSDTAAFLLTGKKTVALDLAFKKGSLCHIEIDSLPPRDPGTLHYMLAPKQLRLLGARSGNS
jgi:phosphohistidine phosphatase